MAPKAIGPETKRQYDRRERDRARRLEIMADTGQTEYRIKRKPRDTAKAQREGYATPSQRRKILALPPELRGQALKRDTLRHFRITENRLNDIRIENLLHQERNSGNEDRLRKLATAEWKDASRVSTAVAINTYREDIDASIDLEGYTRSAVGYVIAFHAAVVNRSTNYDSLEETRTEYYPKKNGKTGSREVKQGNAAQYFYLVQYGGFQTVDQYEARYGATSVVTAKAMGEPKP